jgi:single-strand DNA-binding protein
MPNHAHATITGHLGRDAETKAVGDRYVINFSVAVTRKTKDSETTTWWRVAYWSKSDKLAQYLTKGTPVLAEGTPYLREYESKDGGKKQSLELDARDVVLLGGKQEAAPAAAAPGPRRPAASTADDGMDSPPF